MTTRTFPARAATVLTLLLSLSLLPATSVQAQGGCFVVNLAVDREKPSGLVWDVGTPPDPYVVDTDSGTFVYCRNSFDCAFKAENASSIVHLTVEDRDAKYHDAIGSGSCEMGAECRLGSASISSVPCEGTVNTPAPTTTSLPTPLPVGNGCQYFADLCPRSTP